MNASVEEWLARATGGDLPALNNLLRMYGPRVRQGLDGKLERQWQSVLDLDDVMQVTYLEAFLRIDHFRSVDLAAFVSWLKHIAENNMRDAIKELNREKRPPPGKRVEPGQPDGPYAALMDLLSDGSITPSRHAGNQEMCTIVKAAVEKLPDDYRQVVRLCDFEAKCICEVASLMGRSKGAVHMLRARAHDRLRELLGAESNFFSDSA